MHPLIENYLTDLAIRLRSLPIARRDEELREMRRHLLDAVLVNRAFGQSEAEAVENAVGQFGMPQELAEGLVQMWKRGEIIENKRSFWRVAAYTLGLTFILGLADSMTFLIGQFVPFLFFKINSFTTFFLVQSAA